MAQELNPSSTFLHRPRPPSCHGTGPTPTAHGRTGRTATTGSGTRVGRWLPLWIQFLSVRGFLTCQPAPFTVRAFRADAYPDMGCFFFLLVVGQASAQAGDLRAVGELLAVLPHVHGGHPHRHHANHRQACGMGPLFLRAVSRGLLPLACGLSFVWVVMCFFAMLGYVRRGLKDFLCAVCRAFSCLLCCFEFQLKQVAYIISNNFGFLYDAKSRMIFLILYVPNIPLLLAADAMSSPFSLVTDLGHTNQLTEAVLSPMGLILRDCLGPLVCVTAWACCA